MGRSSSKSSTCSTQREQIVINTKKVSQNILKVAHAEQPSVVFGDTARVNWCGNWRMPTKAEQEELIRNCTWELITQNGVNGYKVTSKVNSNSIFLPLGGYCIEDKIMHADFFGDSWSSNCFSYYPSLLRYTIQDNVIETTAERCNGSPIRPVCE